MMRNIIKEILWNQDFALTSFMPMLISLSPISLAEILDFLRQGTIEMDGIRVKIRSSVTLDTDGPFTKPLAHDDLPLGDLGSTKCTEFSDIHIPYGDL